MFWSRRPESCPYLWHRNVLISAKYLNGVLFSLEDLQISGLNEGRLADSRIDPHTCQLSESHSKGQALLHDFLGALSPLPSIQDACRFDMLTVSSPDADCVDRDTSCSKFTTVSMCYGANFYQAMQTCRRKCGFCYGAVNTSLHLTCNSRTSFQATCLAWKVATTSAGLVNTVALLITQFR